MTPKEASQAAFKHGSIDKAWAATGKVVSRTTFRKLVDDYGSYTADCVDESMWDLTGIGLSGPAKFEGHNKLQRILIVPDTHVPFHDKKAWRLMLKAAHILKPDTIVHLGDLADCYSLSVHQKNPNSIVDWRVECKEVNGCLDELDDIGASRKVFIKGNHEDRLPRYLADKAPALYNAISIEDEFGLDDRGWEVVQYRDSVQIGKFHFTHDTGSGGANAPSKAEAMFQGNVVIGHVHRISTVYTGNAQGKGHVAACVGWLGNADQVHYMHKQQVQRSWQLGFGTLYMESSGVGHLVPVPIIDYKCLIEGQLITL